MISGPGLMFLIQLGQWYPEFPLDFDDDRGLNTSFSSKLQMRIL